MNSGVILIEILAVVIGLIACYGVFKFTRPFYGEPKK